MEPDSFELTDRDDYSFVLIGRDGSQVACGCVDWIEAEDRFEGWLCFEDGAEGLQATFSEFEEIVENQTFGGLDAIDAEIRSLGLRVVFDGDQPALGRTYLNPDCPASLRAVFDGGAAYAVADLQVFPSTEILSFRVAAHVSKPAEFVPAASQE